jgi:hypothetical protein
MHVSNLYPVRRPVMASLLTLSFYFAFHPDKLLAIIGYCTCTSKLSARFPYIGQCLRMDVQHDVPLRYNTYNKKLLLFYCGS